MREQIPHHKDYGHFKSLENLNEVSVSCNDNLNTHVRRAIEYIQKFYQEDFSVGNLADKVGISQVYLNQCFRKELGVSVQQFVIDFRLNKAANLLASTSAPIAEIAALVGYNDPLTFSKGFKKKFNKPPSVYRNESHTAFTSEVK